MRRARAAIYIVFGVGCAAILIGVFADWFSTVELAILVTILVACEVVGQHLDKRIAHQEIPAGPERDYDGAQAVTVHLRNDGSSADETACDIMELEMLLEEALEQDDLGWYDGDAAGPDEWILFLLGPDAEALFAAVEPVLRSYPLSRNALIEIQTTGPDGLTRTVMLGGAA